MTLGLEDVRDMMYWNMCYTCIHTHTNTHTHTHTHTAIDTSVKNVIMDFGNRCASAGPCMKMILGEDFVFLSFC